MAGIAAPGRRELWLAGLALLLVALALAAAWTSRATTLTLAVAPQGGTEPALLRAYAEALDRKRAGLRLRIVAFGGVRESAQALRDGKADLAVVRPDVAMPGNGLTLAVLRELAILVAAPAASGLKTFPDLAGRRLGILASRTADRALVADLVGHHGLKLLADPPAGPVPADAVALVGVEEDGLDAALRARRIDALILVTTSRTPAARRLVGLVRDAAGAMAEGAAEGRADGTADGTAEHGVALFGVPDAAAVLARWPRLQAATVPAALFGAAPRIPEEEVATVGSSYRLMARADLSRSLAAEATQHLFEMRAQLAETVPAADDVVPPPYDDTAQATSARLPIHPGAIDYFEREQESFIERYESWIYLVAILGGGLGSVAAWLRQRLGRLRRERIAVATARLLEIRSLARREADPGRLDAYAGEIDDLAAAIARQALARPAEPRILSAATIALDAARSTLRRARGGPPEA